MNIADKKRLDELCEKARQRKEKILNSPSDYPKDAERYFYIDSIDGNDSADGLSPETAWKSVEKTAHFEFHEGDVVLFRRGGLWRGHIRMQKGVYYSAYGEGEKPKFYGSLDAANPDDWVETKYKNVWMFRPLVPYVRDIGCVVINDGQLWGIKVCKNYKNITLIDAIDFVPHDKNFFLPDLLHPNTLGFGIYAENVINSIKLFMD